MWCDMGNRGRQIISFVVKKTMSFAPFYNSERVRTHWPMNGSLQQHFLCRDTEGFKQVFPHCHSSRRVSKQVRPVHSSNYCEIILLLLALSTDRYQLLPHSHPFQSHSNPNLMAWPSVGFIWQHKSSHYYCLNRIVHYFTMSIHFVSASFSPSGVQSGIGDGVKWCDVESAATTS